MRNKILKYLVAILSFIMSICFVSVLFIGGLILLGMITPIVIVLGVLYIADIMYKEMLKTIEKNTFIEYEEVE